MSGLLRNALIRFLLLMPMAPLFVSTINWYVGIVMPERMFVIYWVWGVGGAMVFTGIGLMVHRRLRPTPAVYHVGGKWYDKDFCPTRKSQDVLSER